MTGGPCRGWLGLQRSPEVDPYVLRYGDEKTVRQVISEPPKGSQGVLGLLCFYAVRASKVGKPTMIWISLAICGMIICVYLLPHVVLLFFSAYSLCWKRWLLYWKDVHIILVAFYGYPLFNIDWPKDHIFQAGSCRYVGTRGRLIRFDTRVHWNASWWLTDPRQLQTSRHEVA